MKYVLAFDSFKGTMSSRRAAQIAERAIRAHDAHAEIAAVALADGGEGLVQAMLACTRGERRVTRVTGPEYAPVDAEWALMDDGTAVVEMAAAAGLLLSRARNPLRTTTYGVGELLLEARRAGGRRVLLGLGGSATNDGGMGMAAALGYRFFDDQGDAVAPEGGSLARVARVERPAERYPLPVLAACDVDNPLCGEHGAAHVFAPQKGADADMVRALDIGLRSFSARLREQLGVDVAEVPGAGAAGGLGAGVLAFIGGALRPGIEIMLDAVGFDRLLDGADWVLTGEGRMDGQSLRGKLPIGVGMAARKRGVPAIALVGALGEGAERAYEMGVTAMFSATRGPASLDEVLGASERSFALLCESVARLIAGSAFQEKF